MTVIRTYFWQPRVKGRLSNWYRRRIRCDKRASRNFVFGNAGDIFARNILAYFYPGAQSHNLETGPRILCVGSIGHRIETGDVLCGVGSKGINAPAEVDRDSVLIHALRGPISEETLRRDGFDTSRVAWHGDPGLVISELLTERDPDQGRVVFIPHYRERGDVMARLPKGIEMVDIDDDPLEVGRKIQAAELVYSSSLHGIIFSHALGRPVVMVFPATEEPLSKFEDYYLGVGLDMPKPLDNITEADFSVAPTSPANLSVAAREMVAPDLEMLRVRGIAS